MTVEHWQILGYVIAGAVALWFVWAVRKEPLSFRYSSASRASVSEVALALVVIAVGLLLRVFLLPEFEGGALTSDENLMSIAYTSRLLELKPIAGAGKAFHSLVLDAWLQLFGLTVLSIRSLSTVVSIVALALWYQSLRVLCGQRVALWATALFSISVFGIYFGRLGYELFWVFFFVPLCLLLFARWRSRHSPVIAAVGGAAAALGLFTYPALLVAYVAVLGALFAAAAWSVIARREIPAGLQPTRDRLIGVTMALVSFAMVAGLGFWLHRTVLAPADGGSFWGGASSLNMTVSSVTAALRQMLIDLFVRGSSWYLIFPAMPFVEVVLLPFFVVGAFIAWFRGTGWWLRGIVLSMPAVLLLSAFSGAYPGMRRAVYLLFPFYFLAAVGIVTFLDTAGVLAARAKASWPRRAMQIGAVAVVAIALAHPVAYQLTYGRRAASWNAGEGYGARKIPMDYLLMELRTGDVLLSRSEFQKYFDHLIYEHYPKLAKRYGALELSAGGVHFIEDADDPAIQTLAERTNWVYLSWSQKNITDFARLHAVCVDLATAKDGQLPLAARSPAEQSGMGQPLCLGEADSPRADSRFEMGFAHPKERFLHRLECQGPYCDERRPGFLYTLGGAVTFVLVPDHGQCDGGCTVVFQLANPQPERLSRVRIAGIEAGELTSTSLDRENRARFPVPGPAVAGDGPIEIELLPADSHYLGWDVVAAWLEGSGPGPAR